jgi:L-ascorbate metabolism protein UlaG (beta-lactamase superfamily)
MSKYPISEHCDGERFFNPGANARPLSDVIKWMRTRQRTPWPASLPIAPRPAPPAAVESGRVAVTFIGHSTVLIRTASLVIITDPVFTAHAGPFGRTGPRRVRPPAIAPASLSPVDLVLVSHNHYDHLQPSSVRLFADTAAFVTTLGVGRQLDLPHVDRRPDGGRHRDVKTGGRDHPFQNPVASAVRPTIHELDWWEKTTIGSAEVTCVPAQHFSARTPWDRNRTLWCGFVVRVDGVTIYFAGDTGSSPHFTDIGNRCPPIDVALQPIGAYEPRWFMTPVHKNPEEAVRAHLDVRARVSVGMHFGTFQLTDEAIDEPVRALETAKRKHRVDAFGVLDFGESVIL